MPRQKLPYTVQLPHYSKEWRAGWRAYWDQVPKVDNPHPDQAHGKMRWNRGWMCAYYFSRLNPKVERSIHMSSNSQGMLGDNRMDSEVYQECFQQGHDAFDSKFSLSDNPYTNPDFRQAWKDGWLAAQKEAPAH